MAGLEGSPQCEVTQCNHPILGAAREGQKHVFLDMDISPPHPPLKNEYITTASSEKLPTGHRNNTQFYTIMLEDTDRITQKYIILKCNLFYIFNLNIL